MVYNENIKKIIDSLESMDKNPMDDIPDIPAEGESIVVKINDYKLGNKPEKPERVERKESKPTDTKYNSLAASYNQAIEDLETIRNERNFYAHQAKNQQDIAVINHEHALKESKASAEKELEEAYDRNDSSALIKAQEKLSKRIYQLEDFERQKRENHNQQIETIGDLGYRPVSPAVNDKQDDFLDQFLSKHPYLDHNSEAYNHRMAKEFEKVGMELEDKYVMAGNHNHVRSPDFFQEVFDEFASKKNIKPTNSNTMFEKNREENYVAPVMLSDNEDTIMSNKKETNFERLAEDEFFVAKTLPDEIIPGIEECRSNEDKIKLKKYYYSVWKNSPEVQERLKHPFVH